ncbi:unnamed protein product [Effrenium voratum]|nr:unnamed protein product [Effrenium voratum]
MKFLGALCVLIAVADDACDSGNMLLQSSARARREKYHWPTGRGSFPNPGISDEVAPVQMNTSLAWSWHHPAGRFHTLTYGTAIDHQLNVYLSAADGLRKFDKNGNLQWEHITLPANLMNAPAIYQGAIYATDTLGGVRALKMSTGEKLWHTQMAEPVGEDNGFSMAHAGVVLTAADHRDPAPMEDGANQKVRALNASTGEVLWSYSPDMPVWNFLPLFPDQETFVFQDLSGGVYRLGLDGREIWKAPGHNGSWTDGGAALGSNGMMYAVNNNRPPNAPADADAPGTLSAYDLRNGALRWQVTTPRPPNNAPAVGKLAGWSGLSVVMPLCQQVLKGAACDVHAYDADTGALRWVFHGPTQKRLYQAGDAEGMIDRTKSGVRALCLPNGWSAPSISGDGTVYVGNEEGPLFALRDLDGDGRVFGENEVSSYDTLAAFSGSSSPAIAPGMLAAASCDSLFVFKA